jgi:NADH-quinone oxidoreductase subunit M
MQNHILSIILFTPLVGALVLLFVPKENKDAIRWIANFFALAGLLVSLPLVPWFWAQRFEPGFKFIEGAPGNWIPSIGASYVLGIDGISFLLIMLTTLLGWISILSSWTAIENRVKEYYIWFLVLQTGMLGVFMALDFFLFFVFWEAMLVPMYLLIGIWGGPRKLYAAIKFFLYTLAGSVLMLLGILFLYFHHQHVTGTYTFALQALYDTAPRIYSDYGPRVATLLFLSFFFAFAIKVPMFPFHTWLPDAHVEAPTAGSVILAGVLLKMGTYGFIRFSLPFFPQVLADTTTHLGMTVRGWMIFLSIVGIIYGALVSLMQKDMKKLVAYSSVSHLGFCTLGIFALTPLGISGSVSAADQSRHLDRRALLDCRNSLRAPPHSRNRRIRRHLQRHADLRDYHHDHVPVVDGPAAAQRLRRRVHDPSGHVHGKLALGRMGGPWGRARCCLFVVALPASLLRHGHQSQERKAA